MTIIGVTGGMGSGKSVVCKLLSLYNIPIYDADIEAKRLNDTSSVIRQKMEERFGDDIYKNNVLDKKLLAHHIFNNQENLKFANKIIHTELAKHFLNWVEENKEFKIITIDAPVLFEAGFDKFVDKIITVTAPIDKRIERVSKRDKLTREQIITRINNQMSDEERIKLSDFVVINDDNHSIIKQTDNILRNIYTSLQD